MSDQSPQESQAAAGSQAPTDKRPRQGLVAGLMVGLVVAMGAMSYAAVPLYKMFCQVTGYGGTTKKADKAPAQVLERKMRVYFDANTSRDLPWKFKPLQDKVMLKIGETALVYYTATNMSDKPLTGTATFNVTPVQAGSFFNKIECFCFTEQTLQPGESIKMPVNFFIDPEIVSDPDAKMLNEITLSYTFFPVETDKKAAKKPVVNRAVAKETNEKS